MRERERKRGGVNECAEHEASRNRVVRALHSLCIAPPSFHTVPVRPCVPGVCCACQVHSLPDAPCCVAPSTVCVPPESLFLHGGRITPSLLPFFLPPCSTHTHGYPPLISEEPGVRTPSRWIYPSLSTSTRPPHHHQPEPHDLHASLHQLLDRHPPRFFFLFLDQPPAPPPPPSPFSSLLRRNQPDISRLFRLRRRRPAAASFRPTRSSIFVAYTFFLFFSIGCRLRFVRMPA